jgi:hypothetical protein
MHEQNVEMAPPSSDMMTDHCDSFASCVVVVCLVVVVIDEVFDGNFVVVVEMELWVEVVLCVEVCAEVVVVLVHGRLVGFCVVVVLVHGGLVDFFVVVVVLFRRC